MSEPAEDAPAQVTLQIYENPRARGNTPCDQNERDLFYGPPIPALAAPPESTILYVDGAGGDPSSNGSSSIFLETDLSAETLIEHYDAQLLEAGWTARDGGGAESPVGWRRYSFTSDGAPWLGLLQILSDDAFPQQYLGQVLVIRTAP